MSAAVDYNTEVPILTSGDTVDDALKSLSIPADSVRLVVVSPYAPRREQAFREIKERWEHVATRELEEKLGKADGGEFVAVDLRKCEHGCRRAQMALGR